MTTRRNLILAAPAVVLTPGLLMPVVDRRYVAEVVPCIIRKTQLPCGWGDVKYGWAALDQFGRFMFNNEQAKRDVRLRHVTYHTTGGRTVHYRPPSSVRTMKVMFE